MKAQIHLTLIGIFALCLSFSWSLADKGGQPHYTAPAPIAAQPMHIQQAPHLAPTLPPTVHTPPPPPVHQAPIHVPPPTHIHQAPVQIPKPQPQIHQAPLQGQKSQPPNVGPKFNSPPPQPPAHVTQPQSPIKSLPLKQQPPRQ